MENPTNQERDEVNQQQNSNLPNKEKENDAPASGIKNNDAWTTGLEAKTPMQESNPPTYKTTDNPDQGQEPNSTDIKDPDEWKTGYSTSEEKKTDSVADQNHDREKENSF